MPNVGVPKCCLCTKSMPGAYRRKYWVPRTRALGGCEPLRGARNQTQILRRSVSALKHWVIIPETHFIMFNLNIYTMHQLWKESSEHTIFTLIKNKKVMQQFLWSIYQELNKKNKNLLSNACLYWKEENCLKTISNSNTQSEPLSTQHNMFITCFKSRRVYIRYHMSIIPNQLTIFRVLWVAGHRPYYWGAHPYPFITHLVTKYTDKTKAVFYCILSKYEEPWAHN